MNPIGVIQLCRTAATIVLDCTEQRTPKPVLYPRHRRWRSVRVGVSVQTAGKLNLVKTMIFRAVGAIHSFVSEA
jgi:hypothetical protein